MAKLVLIEYKPAYWTGILVLTIAVPMGYLAFSNPVPKERTILGFVGALGTIAGLFVIVSGHMMSKAYQGFAKIISTEGDRLRFGRPLALTPGEVQIMYGNGTTYPSFHPSGRPSEYDQLRPELRGKAYIIHRFEWFSTSGYLPKEVVRAPAFRVDEKGFRAPRGFLIIGVLPRLRHEIEVESEDLTVSRGGDFGVAKLKVRGSVLGGYISFRRERARALRLELEVSAPGIKYSYKLAELKESGAVEFAWSPDIREPVYFLITSLTAISVDSFLKKLGITTPKFSGNVWNFVRAEVKLILDFPFERDVISSTSVSVTPLDNLQTT